YVSVYAFFFFKQKTAYEIFTRLEFRRVLFRSTDKIEQRYARASGELGERMRQSEERTARLLAEARESIEQRGARAVRRETPLEKIGRASCREKEVLTPTYQTQKRNLRPCTTTA